MKRRILILGRNQLLIDGFFYHMSDTMECLTASNRSEDIAGHIRYFHPEMLVVCMQSETKETLAKIAGICKMMYAQRIPVLLIGDMQECDQVKQEAGSAVTLMMGRTAKASMIAQEIEKYLEKTQPKTPQAEAKAPEAMPQEVQTSKAGEMPALKPTIRRHITVIDDDAQMLKVIKEYLREDYDVATALNGKTAIKFLENKHTDLILLDYVMPEEDGPEVYKKIRSMEEYRETPIVFLTGLTEREKIKKVVELHPQGYMLKPVERDRLLTTVYNILE